MCDWIRPLIEADVPLKLRTIYIRDFYISELIERKIGRILRLNRKDGANPNMKEHSCFEIDSDKTIDPRN